MSESAIRRHLLTALAVTCVLGCEKPEPNTRIALTHTGDDAYGWQTPTQRSIEMDASGNVRCTTNGVGDGESGTFTSNVSPYTVGRIVSRARDGGFFDETASQAIGHGGSVTLFIESGSSSRSITQLAGGGLTEFDRHLARLRSMVADAADPRCAL